MARVDQIASIQRYRPTQVKVNKAGQYLVDIDDAANVEKANVFIDEVGQDGWYPSMEQAIELASDIEHNYDFIRWIVFPREIRSPRDDALSNNPHVQEVRNYLNTCMDEFVRRV